VNILFLMGLPFCFISYSSWTTHVGINVAGFLDHATMVLFFMAAYAAFLRFTGPFARGASTFFLTSGLSCFFLFNTLHYRFFSTWGNIDAVQQWDDLASILTGIQHLLRPADWVFFIAIPFLVWIFSLRLSSPSRRFLSMCILWGCVFSGGHAFLASPEILYKENNPLLYALRQKWKSVHPSTHRDSTPLLAQRFQALNTSLYTNAESQEFPLLKHPTPSHVRLAQEFQKPPNVVLILMESMRAYESGAYGAPSSLTPNLDRLAREGMIFENFYANGSQTVRSEFAIQTSFMPRMIGSPEYVTDPQAPFVTWPMLLRKHGYQTMWIGSYTPTYDNKQEFHAHHGITAFHWSLPRTAKKVGWGPSDEDLFRYAFKVLTKQKAPYYAEIMTLSNHFPWDDPMPTATATPFVQGEELYKKYAQGMFYTDFALGQFFDQVRKTPAFDNTLFIVTGDHGVWLFPEDRLLTHPVLRQEAYFRVPLVLWSPAHLKPAVIHALGSQIDLGPTVLDVLGIHEANYFLGTSLLRQDVQHRFVLMVQDGRWNLRQGPLFTYDIGPQVFENHYPFDEAAYNRLIKGKKVGHITFAYDGDLLRDRNPAPLKPLEEHIAAAQRAFAESALRYYQELFQNKKTAPKDEGLTK